MPTAANLPGNPLTDAATACRPPSLILRWILPEADSAHAEAACHEIEATALPESGTAHSIHSKAPGKAAEQEVTDVQPGLTYEVCGTPCARVAWLCAMPCMQLLPQEQLSLPSGMATVMPTTASSSPARYGLTESCCLCWHKVQGCHPMHAS